MIFSSSSAGSVNWFARHEFNLSWRDFLRMMTAGKPGREKAVIGFVAFAALVMHIIAYATIKPSVDAGLVIDKTLLLAVTGSILLTLSLMMSQAMELVTRTFYARSDLDLILSSPVSARKLFTVRIAAIASATTMLSLLLFGAAINVLALFHSIYWLAAYPVILACGSVATAASLTIIIFMFKIFGAEKTRLISQIIAAVVGAGFIIGVQLAAIASMGSISRIEFFRSGLVTGLAPATESLVWIPARAVTGDPLSLAAVLGASFLLLGTTILAFAGSFGEHVITAAGINQARKTGNAKKARFTNRSIRATLRRKEWTLLLRDHWLLSQTLMQILYLVPPAFMLWQGFGNAGALGVVAIPVLVMASGQLSGGLAWLAISGEDAPELVQTAPIMRGAVIRAKVEAVLGAIGFIVSPILFMIALMDWKMAIIAAAGIALSTVSATMIQLWFRSQANRSNFRRRQTSSKVATLSEAFSSILWAGATGLAAAGSWLFVFLVPLALGVLWIARSFKPETG